MTPPGTLTVRGFGAEEHTGPRVATRGGEIVGRVKGAVPAGATVHAVVRTLHQGSLDERVVGVAPVEPDGSYHLAYDPLPSSSDASDTSLTVRLYSADGGLIAVSAPVLSPPPRVRIDVRPPRARDALSEYTLLEQRLAENLAAGAEALDGAEEDVLQEVSDWVDVDPERLALLQDARARAGETGLPAPVFYALGRNGLNGPLEDLLDVRLEELRTTLQEAIADGTVDACSMGDVDALIPQLGERIIEHAMRPEAEAWRPGLGEVLATADLPAEAMRDVLRRYQARSGTASEFWESFTKGDGTSEAVDDAVASQVGLAVRLGTIVGPDPPLLRHMHQLRRDGRWHTAEDLASFSFEDWCDLLEDVEVANESDGEETPEDGEEWQERIEARAEGILDTLEDTYPSEFIRQHFAESTAISPAARALIARVPYNFHTESIRDRLSAEPELSEGFDASETEAAIEEVEAIERISRVADRADEIATLVETGIRSAMEIVEIPGRQFGELYGEALGGRAQAARVHGQAQQQTAAVRMLALRLLQALQRAPVVLGQEPPAIAQTPDMRQLFEMGGGYCDCEHCGSVYSPAAYFVDLLRYLNVSTPERIEQLGQRFRDDPNGRAAQKFKERLATYQPLDVLLGRRPDLADLPLTCENTLTPLPYIDIVNELLEAAMTRGSAAFDTGKTPADVLRAVPQNISREAYQKLQEAVHPLALPYHQPLALARAYLAHLGVTRLELIRALGRGEAARDAVTAESLGMAPEEFGFITLPTVDAWRHAGFTGPVDATGVSYVTALARVPTFLDATGITFQTLIDLVSTRFLNADNILQLDTPSTDCDPNKVRVEGLDEARLSRLLQLIRLQRRLGWAVADLDRALVAFGAKELDAAVLEKLAAAQELAKALDRPLAELLVLWAPIDTWGKGNQFDKLFTTRAVTWRTQDERTFHLRPDRSELAETGATLDAVAPALLAAFRITNDELMLIRALLTRRGAEPKLDLAGLSAVYRVIVLARALQLRIAALDLLLRLTPPDADPFQAGAPGSTRRFVDIVRDVQSSDFTPERLAYLFRHEWEPRRDPGPLPAQVEAVLGNIRRGLADAFGETTHPADASGDTLRQKLAALFDPPLLDPAMEVLDPRTALPIERRRAFFNRHLARLFPDPEAAAARLFGAPPPIAPPPAAVPPAPVPPAPAPPAPVPATQTTPTAAPAEPAPAAPPAPPQEPPPAPTPTATPVSEATSPPTPAAPPDAMETRWRANIHLVLEHALPILRQQQLRGAVIQTLSDTLGMTPPATARLLDVVLRSRRRPGEPLLGDFLALLGTGLTGAYFTNADLSGEPAVVRVDPELTFAWAGAAPAPNVPGRQFSVRWTGHLLVRTRAPHTFYIQTEGAVRLSLKVDRTDRVLIDQPAGTRITEHASEPVALEPNRLYEIRLEYRNQGTPATIIVQFGTGPAAKLPIPTPDLYPADGLSSFAAIEDSYRRLHKAALIVSGFSMTGPQLEWLTTAPAFLDLDALPMQPGNDADGVGLFGRWRQLARLFTLRKQLPRSNTDLFEVFRAATMNEAIDRLVLATGWDRTSVEAFLGADGMAIDAPAAFRPSAEATENPLPLRLARAMDIQRRIGVAPATLYTWANTVPDADVAATIVQAVKARYDETRWLEVARTLNDPLRAERRDALVAYLLPRMKHLGVVNRNQLFEYFLIDVDMNPCMLTSRIRQATGAVQTFFQRCLMNLEPKVPARVIDENDWKWLKNYRVWEANRKVFLYPENWIEPELRDDKSPLFQTLESTILQQEIKNDNVEGAFADYLESLDEIARLDVRGVWFERRTEHRMARPAPSLLRDVYEGPPPPRLEWDHGTYHVFGRTFNAPHVWYYRRLESGRAWTPWEKIDADIEGDHLVPIVFNRRLHLFWSVFREVNKEPPDVDKESKGPPPSLGKDWEIQLAYSVYDRGKWSRKRLSAGGVKDVQTFVKYIVNKPPKMEGSTRINPADYSLRGVVVDGDPPRLQIHVYCRAVDRLQRTEVALVPAELQHVATFELNGCSGALLPDRLETHTRATLVYANLPTGLGGLGRMHAAIGNIRAGGGASHLFRLTQGGIVNAPAGYQVAGMGYAPSHHGGSLLAFAPEQGGLSVALPRSPDRRHVSVLPVIDPRAPEARGLYPFFFQDRFRSYFARPVYTGFLPPRLVAVPLTVRRPILLAPRRGRPAPARPVQPVRQPPRRPVRRRRRRLPWGREDIDESMLIFEARDAWEDLQDEAWHPDDAAEARSRRRRNKPAPPRPRPQPRPAPRPATRPAAPARSAPVAARPRVTYRREGGFHEQRLLFTPFEHADTCRLLERLKATGIDGLLDFSTTRPIRGIDHAMVGGKWTPRQTWFERHYGVGPLVYEKRLPHLDIAFENDGPYSVYNWELFFHAPLQIAVRLAKDGRHEEAQRWFHFIFDPTTDSSAPSPQRYWRFAPFYENNNEFQSARDLMQVLSYDGKDAAILTRQSEVRNQLAAWWEKPFSPHVIARLRITAYQKAVVMKYIDNLIEWGDKLFRRDSMESIQEATQIYILAANILGPRPEKIPPVVSKPPLTFQQMRHGLNLFSNFEVRLENLQVRRPFRINARPDRNAARVVLSMATQYFCTPPNPQLDKYWDTVADRLFKIRNCMNIQGIVRQLPLFEPPIDPGLLVRAAAAGVDLGSVIASLNAPPPHYRFRFLLARAVRLAEEIRSFGAMTLQVLERRDAEGLAALRASNETLLLDAVRDIAKKQVRQAEEAVAQLSLEREHVDLQIQHLNTQLQNLMNPQEQAQQKSLTAAQVVSGVAEGVDLVAKVMHAIPEFQTGGAGAFSSPFVTLQLGGQMLGDIAGAFAASLEKVVGKNETEADLAAKQAEYQRRREEWQHELELLTKHKAQIDKQIAEAQIKLEITSAELRRHELEVENSRKVQTYLRDKYTNQQLYGWMLGQVSTVYFQAYKVAFDAAQHAERAFRFERGDSSSTFIEFSYWDSLKKGLFAGERLLVDLRRMESAYVEGDRRALEVTRHISLRDDFPLALQELLATGRCQIEVTEALLDGDFPGQYFRRLKTVSLTVAGTQQPNRNVNCTLTLLENRVRTDANASGSYAQSADGEDSRFLLSPAPIQAIATSKPDADPGLFQLRFDDDRFLPFEGAGAISTWRIEMPQADNSIDLAGISDVVVTLSYTARIGGAALEAAARGEREKGLARGGIKPEALHALSLKRDVPDGWKRLSETAAGQEIELPLPLDAARFSGRYRGLDLRIERVTIFAHVRGTVAADALRVRLDPPKGSGTPVTSWSPPWPQSRTLRATAEVSGPAGAWKVAVTSTGGKVVDLLDDLVFVFELRARKESRT